MRFLVAHSFFPEPDTNSGSLRLWELLLALQDQGHSLSFLAAESNDLAYRAALERVGVSCVSDEENSLSSRPLRFREFLKDGAFQAAVLVQHGIFNHYAPFLRAFLPRCRLILDTVDLHSLRARREAELAEDPAALGRAVEVERAELAAALNADAVWTVSEAERESLRSLLPAAHPIHVLPNVHRACAAPPGRAQRRGIVFLGGYRHPPNVDAVHHFFRSIFPALRLTLPDLRVTIAGSHSPPEFERYRGMGVTVAGRVEDHRALLNAHLVGLAPLRYGAGIKGKIGEYLACGLPCVTTSIGAEGMGLRHGTEALIVDGPVEFARAIARLHRDEELWSRLSEAGLRHVQERLSPESLALRLRQALAGLGAPRRASLFKPSDLVLTLRGLWDEGSRELCCQRRLWRARRPWRGSALP